MKRDGQELSRDRILKNKLLAFKFFKELWKNAESRVLELLRGN